MFFRWRRWGGMPIGSIFDPSPVYGMFRAKNIARKIKRTKTLDLISTIIDKLWYKYVNLHVFVH